MTAPSSPHQHYHYFLLHVTVFMDIISQERTSPPQLQLLWIKIAFMFLICSF